MSTEARNDTIIIYDGSAVNPQKIVTGFDGDHWNPLPIAINTNEPYVLFEFKTNSAVTSTGFKVSYTSADKSKTCDKLDLGSLNNFIAQTFKKRKEMQRESNQNSINHALQPQ